MNDRAEAEARYRKAIDDLEKDDEQTTTQPEHALVWTAFRAAVAAHRAATATEHDNTRPNIDADTKDPT